MEHASVANSMGERIGYMLTFLWTIVCDIVLIRSYPDRPLSIAGEVGVLANIALEDKKMTSPVEAEVETST